MTLFLNLKRSQLLLTISKLRREVLKIEDLTQIVEKCWDRSESGENSSYIEDIIVLLGEILDNEADFDEKLIQKLILILVQYNSVKVSNSIIKIFCLITKLEEKLENSVNKIVGNVCFENMVDKIMTDFKKFKKKRLLKKFKIK